MMSTRCFFISSRILLYKVCGIILGIGFFQFSIYAQDLSAPEKDILRYVDENHDESVGFLRQTVDINSGTMNPRGVKEVGEIYQQFLKDLGFETRWVDMPKEMNRGGHLIAELDGGPNMGTSQSVMLLGHLDTVFEEDSPFQRWEVKDSRAYGPGTNDMKGGNMVMLYSLKALKDAGLLDGRKIVVVLHGDEENPGRPISVSRRDILELAEQTDIALAYEPSTGMQYATTARRSSSGWTLQVEGIQAHSAGVFSKSVGSGAIYEAARILHRFHEELREENLTYNAGLIVGGSDASLDATGVKGQAEGKTNLVADALVVRGDIRTISNEQLGRTRERMTAIVAESHPQTSAKITFNDGYPAMVETLGNRSLLTQFNRVNVDLGLGEVQAYNPNLRGAGDIAFIADYMDCLDGLGVQGGGAHSVNEFVKLNTISDVTKRSALLIYRLTQPN